MGTYKAYMEADHLKMIHEEIFKIFKKGNYAGKQKAKTQKLARVLLKATAAMSKENRHFSSVYHVRGITYELYIHSRPILRVTAGGKWHYPHSWRCGN